MMEFTLTFTEQQMRIINAALVELPFKIVAPVIQSINEQIVAASQKGEQDELSRKSEAT